MPTFNQIISEMMKLRNPGKYPIYQVKAPTTQASPGVKSVMYKAVVMGEENEYPVYIQFRGVEFSKEEKSGFIPFESTDKTGASEISYYKTPELGKNPISLKCMCTDFRFMWEYPLYKAKALIGQFRRYVRKTTTYPPKNPENILGVCKHIWSFVRALQESKLVK